MLDDLRCTLYACGVSLRKHGSPSKRTLTMAKDKCAASYSIDPLPTNTDPGTRIGSWEAQLWIGPVQADVGHGSCSEGNPNMCSLSGSFHMLLVVRPLGLPPGTPYRQVKKWGPPHDYKEMCRVWHGDDDCTGGALTWDVSPAPVTPPVNGN